MSAKSYFLRLRGLSYTATEEDVREFFDDLELEDIFFVSSNGHRDCFCEFTSQLDANKAMKKNHEYIGNNSIQILSVGEIAHKNLFFPNRRVIKSETTVRTSSSKTFPKTEKSYIHQLAGIIVFVAIVALFFVWPPAIFKRTSTGLPTKLLKDINRIVRNEFGGDDRIRSVMRYAFEMLFNTDVKAPVVVLLAGHDNNTERFLNSFRQLLVDNIRHTSLPFLDLSDTDPSNYRRLERKIFEYLRAEEENRVVIMERIDRLTSSTPLLLHAICDPDTAPEKKLLLIATLSPPKLPKSMIVTSNTASGRRLATIQNRECDECVTDHLINAWNDLKPDKIYPIISRISAILLCLI